MTKTNFNVVIVVVTTKLAVTNIFRSNLFVKKTLTDTKFTSDSFLKKKKKMPTSWSHIGKVSCVW